MKRSRLSTPLSTLGLFACLNLPGVCPQAAGAEPIQYPPIFGATYIITNTTPGGAFASRGALTLNADHTLSVIDSGQGGPTYYFSSQLGAWTVNSAGAVVGRAVDFDFKPDTDIARLEMVRSIRHSSF